MKYFYNNRVTDRIYCHKVVDKW